jgi:tRNA(fMet)-specific endonuclease VapC
VGDEVAAISVITVSELLHGVHRATTEQRPQRSAFVERLLYAYIAIPVTDAVARVHAQVWAALEESGSMIGPHDVWIAATALTHALGVVTRNPGDFARVPGLRVVAL